MARLDRLYHSNNTWWYNNAQTTMTGTTTTAHISWISNTAASTTDSISLKMDFPRHNNEYDFELRGHNHNTAGISWYEPGDLLIGYEPQQPLSMRFNTSNNNLFRYCLQSHEQSIVNWFNKDLPRDECCFKPVYAPWDYFNNKYCELEPCNEVPRHRIASNEMGVPLDYCKKHFRIAIKWHQSRFGKMPNMVKKFTDKDLAEALQAKLNRDKERLERELHITNANTKADELLRKWLSESEYNYLKENDELELPSQYEKDVVYIVKKNVDQKVVKKVSGVATVELCIMPVDSMLVNDDGLLSKILLLKTDEKEFLKIANVYPLI